MTSNIGLYIYCVMTKTGTKGLRAKKGKPEDLGIRNHQIYEIGYKDLNAVVSDFPLEQLKANMEDVISHQKVVENKRRIPGTTVLPVRFGTILRNQEEVTNLLSKSYNEYKSKLSKLNGKNEFGLKVLITNTTREKLKDLVEVESKEIKNMKDNISSLSANSSGSTYLLKLNLEDAIKNGISKKIERLADEIHQQFVLVSEESNLLNADIEQVILNAAYLLNQNNDTVFKSKFQELKSLYGSVGLIFHMSGPWAPYSFLEGR
jgi:Gas vesicle synthesis protein GvpL/GvpF